MDKHTRQRDIQVSVMKDILNKLLIIASIGLAAAGVIFLVISFTGKFDGHMAARGLAYLHSAFKYLQYYPNQTG